MNTDTVKVQREGGKGYSIIDRAKYEANKDNYVLFEADREAANLGTEDSLDEDAKKHLKTKEIERKAEANRGIVGNSNVVDTLKNPSGTYSEPTPTDIRYPNKDETEFENNHGAFVNKSAAGMRKELGLLDEPGGLNPKRHKNVKQAEEAVAAAGATDVEDGDDLEEDEPLPENWQSLPWRQQKALAEKVSGKKVVSAAEARAILEENAAASAGEEEKEED